MIAGMSDRAIGSMLPYAWVPDDAAIYVLARLDEECADWEAIAPEFSIAGMGSSADGSF